MTVKGVGAGILIVVVVVGVVISAVSVVVSLVGEDLPTILAVRLAM